MHKRIFLLPLAGVISFGLVGCNNDTAGGDADSNNNQPFGYYSNEDHKGDTRILNDDDGPIIDMLDGYYGENNDNQDGKNRRDHDKRNQDQNRGNQVMDEKGSRENNRGNQVMDENTNQGIKQQAGVRGEIRDRAGQQPPQVKDDDYVILQDRTRPLAGDDQTLLGGDHRYSRNDANYHGHLNNDLGRARTSYYDGYNGALAERLTELAKSVANVDDARAAVLGNDIVIAADLDNEQRVTSTKRQISEKVLPYVKGKDIHVVTDIGTFSTIRTLDNDLRNGTISKRDVDRGLRSVMDSARNLRR